MELHTQDATWERNRQRINGLWPRYEPTNDERDLTASRLGKLNQRWLAAAIDEYRANSDSGVFKLAELLTHYRRIANAGAERARTQTGKSAGAVWDSGTRETSDDAQSRLEADREHCIGVLRDASRADIAATVKRLRDTRWLGDEKLPTDFTLWRNHSLFVVVAGLQSK